jgi:hypothetical protein
MNLVTRSLAFVTLSAGVLLVKGMYPFSPRSGEQYCKKTPSR